MTDRWRQISPGTSLLTFFPFLSYYTSPADQSGLNVSFPMMVCDLKCVRTKAWTLCCRSRLEWREASVCFTRFRRVLFHQSVTIFVKVFVQSWAHYIILFVYYTNNIAIITRICYYLGIGLHFIKIETETNRFNIHSALYSC